jgi:GNAT superfamily N-acetyltransferase
MHSKIDGVFSAASLGTRMSNLGMKAFTTPYRALALSLWQDPFYQAITIEQAGSEEDQLATLEKYFEYSLGEAQRTGHCILAQRSEEGAAAWLLPRTIEVSVLEDTAKVDFIAALLGTKGSSNYRAIINFMSDLSERHVPNEAWYLSIVGVHPAAQGKGLGQRLLEPTLKEASAQRKICYLETFTPRNLVFYQRLGFIAVAEYAEPVTQSSYVIMRRDP